MISFLQKTLFFKLLLIIVFLAGACADEVNVVGKESRWKSVQIPFTYQNVQVPKALLDLIKKKMAAGGATKKTMENFSITPISLQVELSSQETFVLKEAYNYRLFYVEGGGVLDLFEYVTGKGPMYIRLSPHLEDGVSFYLLYISDSPGKEINGDVWGNGCGRIFDLTESASQFLLESGIKVTSSKKHYMHLLAGTFVFAQLVDDRLHLGYVRIKDSRYPQFKCKNS